MIRSEVVGQPLTDAACMDAELERDCRALAETAAFRILDDRLIVRVTGDDRVPFFHGMCSNDIKAAKPGAVVPALFLTERAHVIGECFIWVDQNALVVETDLGSWPHSREQLERLLVADDVEMEDVPMEGVLHIEGPRAAGALEAAKFAVSAMAPWTFAGVTGGMLGRVARSGTDGFSLIGDRQLLDETARRLQAGGAVAVSAQALEIVRVENGVARVGLDATEKTIALEARLERAISFNKGCYVGQETVERATARGGIKKKLFGLRFPERGVEPGAALLLEGKEFGHVSSSVISPRLGAIGLGILHHSAWKEGTKLLVRDALGETVAVVSEIPFKPNFK